MARRTARARGRPREKRRKDGPEYLYTLGIAEMTRVKLERAMLRWEKMLQRCKRYEFPNGLHIPEHMTAALDAMRKTVKALERVPETWKPAVGAVGVQMIEKGCFVQLRERVREKYFYIDDPAQVFEVKIVNGSRIMCLVPSSQGKGTLVQTVFPRAHIQLVELES